jgi:hypothetical protein
VKAIKRLMKRKNAIDFRSIDLVDEITTIAAAAVVIAGLPFYVMAAVSAATASVKLINEAFGSATEKQIQDTLTDPKK